MPFKTRITEMLEIEHPIIVSESATTPPQSAITSYSADPIVRWLPLVGGGACWTASVAMMKLFHVPGQGKGGSARLLAIKNPGPFDPGFGD